MTAPIWQITSISATPDIACVNSEGDTIFPIKQKIWDPNGNYIDNAYDGSLIPVTFLTPPSLDNYHAAITVKGACTYPQSWQGEKYIISGWLGDTKILQSGVIPVPNDENFNATNFFLMSPNLSSAAIIPFRCSGDFVWGISLASAPETSYKAAKRTRLELCWSRAVAPDGPSVPNNITKITRVNLSPGYPIALFRLFSPYPSEFSDIAPREILKWYIKRNMTAIWDWPNINNDHFPRYDVLDGNSQYGMRGSGGSFQLVDWMNKKFTTLNCYDLNGIYQLACAILVDQNGAEIVNSRWVWHHPHGFINPGPLYGWNKVEDGKKHIECNNPFWANPKNFPLPNAPRSDPTRSGFPDSHSWVEIEIDKGVPAVVLDACHTSTKYPYPDAGTRTREVYLAKILDDERPQGNGQNKQGPNGPGHCYLNPYYRTIRLGVLDTNGQPSVEPSPSPTPTIHLGAGIMEFTGILNTTFQESVISGTLEVPLSTDLEETIERGKNPGEPGPFFNIASVNPDTLIPLLSPVSGSSGLEHQTTKISIRHGATRLNLTFKHLKPSNVKAIDLTIDIFNSFEDATKALISHILSFEARPLSSIILPLEAPIGNFSYQAAGSIFWVSGNQFINIQEIEVDPVAHPELLVLQQTAAILDEHLTLSGEDTGVPEAFLDDINPIPHIRHGHSYDIYLREVRPLLKTRQVSCDDSKVLLPFRTTSESGELKVFALALGRTQVRVYIADAVTLRPGEVDFEVVVVPGLDSRSAEVDTGVLMELVDTGNAPPI